MPKSTLFFIFLKEERKKFEIMKSDILFSDLTVYPVELVNAKKDRGKLCILFYTLYTGCLFFDSQTSFDKYFYGINFCTIFNIVRH